MKLNVQCSCGAVYDVDFEPVDGKLPGDFICPHCKANLTDSTNQQIAAALAPAASAPPPPPATRPGLKLRKPGEMLSQPDSTPPVVPVPKSPPTPPPVPPPMPQPPAAESPTTATNNTPSATSERKIRLRRPDAAAPSATASQMPVSRSEAAPASPVPQAEPEPAPSESTSIPQFCVKHPNEPIAVMCFVCKRPMCAICMKKTGFVCSAYCQGKAKDQGIEIPVFEGQESYRDKYKGGSHRVGLAFLLILLGLAAAAGWYHFYGSRPSVAMSVPTSAGHGAVARFLNPFSFYVLQGNDLTLYDTAAKAPKWKYTRAAADTKSESAATSLEQDLKRLETITDPQERQRAILDMWQQRAKRISGDSFRSRVYPGRGYLWMVSGSELLGIETASGVEKAKHVLPGRIESVSVRDQGIMAISRNPHDARIKTLSYIELPAATITSTNVLAVMAAPASSKTPTTHPPTGQPTTEMDEIDVRPSRRFLPAGPNIAQVDVSLMRKNIVMEDAMRPRDKPVMGADLKVTDVAAAFEEIQTDMRRQETGGKKAVDKSDYRVTLRRHLGATKATDWTGMVIGPPKFFTTQTVDVLTAGQNIYIFDKNNQLLWQDTLAFPVGPVEVDPQNPESGPCIERLNTLYVADQGALRAFDLQTKKVKWTYITVGISRIQFDDEGMIYLTSTTASPDTIQYTQDVRITDRALPVLIKVNSQTGQEIWKLQKTQAAEFDAHVSGKFIYLTTGNISSFDMLKAMETKSGEVPYHFRITRLNPKDGKPMWEFYRASQPQSVDFAQNQILVQWPNELQLLKYLALY